MFRNVSYTTLALFCLTFIVGLISSDIYQPIITLREKESPQNITVKTNKAVEETLEMLEKDKLECIPVDGNLKYRYLENKSPEFDLNENEISDMDQLSKLRENILLLEEKLENEKSLDIEKRIKLEKELKTLKDKYTKLLKEQFNIDDSIELLYREVCKETK